MTVKSISRPYPDPDDPAEMALSRAWGEVVDRLEAEDRTVSRPKDQNEPATPPGTQTRTLGWTGYSPTVRELRGWLDKIPDQATIELRTIVATNSYRITATWEVP